MHSTSSLNKWPFFYGFVITIIGTLGIWASVPGQTVGVSTFTDPVKDALGLSRNEFSWAYTCGTIASSLLLGMAGKWFDKYGARWVAFFAALGLSMALFISSQSSIIAAYLQVQLNVSSWIIPFLVIMCCFFFIRFAGQGVLTMASRNMIMLWFDQYRGRINAISSVAVSLGFSISPLWISHLIDLDGWQHAWQYMGIGLAVIAVLIFIFYRDSPEKVGLVPDGNLSSKQEKQKTDTTSKQYTKKDAIKTRAFWVYSLMLAFNGYFITGLTFHIISVFNSVGLTKEDAISIFIPMSVISVTTSILFNALSDMMKLKNLLFLMIASGFISSFGLTLLSYTIGYYMLIVGCGMMGGLFAVLISVTWPRFFGRRHLGAISGLTMQMIVFASALGPLLFSYSYKLFDSYSVIAMAGLSGLIFMSIASIKADNPQ